MDEKEYVPVKNGILTIEDGGVVRYQGPGGDLRIPPGVEYIGCSAFAFSALTDITLPDSLTDILNEAFYGCGSLRSVRFPDRLASIGRSAFSGCSSLTAITLPDGLDCIEDWTFDSCRGLTSITIPAGMESIGKGAFAGCDRLTSLTIPDSVTEIGEEAFCGCANLTGLTVSNGDAAIGEGAFRGCAGLADQRGCVMINQVLFDYTGPGGQISIPDDAGWISRCAFYERSDLTGISIPEGVTGIGRGAFFGCAGLTDLTLPDSLTVVGYKAFSDCTGLTWIRIPPGVFWVTYDAERMETETFKQNPEAAWIDIPYVMCYTSYVAAHARYPIYLGGSLTDLEENKRTAAVRGLVFALCHGLDEIQDWKNRHLKNDLSVLRQAAEEDRSLLFALLEGEFLDEEAVRILLDHYAGTKQVEIIAALIHCLNKGDDPGGTDPLWI